MKPSLLTIILLTGSVHSRSLWDLFNLLFGDKADSEKQNKIPGDDEDDKGRKPVVNHADVMENNEIFVKNPRTHERWNPTDNRVGWTYKVKADITTEEGYAKVLEELSQYIGNFSGQDHGKHSADYYFDVDDDDDDDDPFDGYDEDLDYSDTEYSYDSDSSYHDELRI